MLKPGGTYYIHADHLNTPRQIEDQSGDTVWVWDTITFGASPPDEDPQSSGTPFIYHLRHPGQYYDTESGLFQNWHRDYNPSLGRYVESDPIGLAGGINTYAYVGGNPILLADPYGLWEYDFNAGLHIHVPGAGMVGPNFNATYTPGQGLNGATFSQSMEAVFGSLADIGVNAGIGGLSNCQNGEKTSVSLNLPFFGKYGGLNVNFVGGSFDGFNIGLGLGLALPMTYTKPYSP